MQVTITNVTSESVLIQDLYTTIEAGESITVERSSTDLPRMASLQKNIADGNVTISVTPTADEIASGLLQSPQTIQAADMAPVDATDVAAGLVVLRVPLVAGGGGSPDDVQAYAANALPFKFRVLDAWAMVSTGVGASTLNVYTQAAGAGTLVAGPLDSAAAGIVRMTGPNASALAVPGATEGLFIRRSDDGVAGEVCLLVRREN